MFGVSDETLFEHTVGVCRAEQTRRQENNIKDCDDVQEKRILFLLDDDEDPHRTLDWIQTFDPQSYGTSSVVQFVSASTFAYHHRETHDNQRDLCVKMIRPIANNGVLHLSNTITLLSSKELEEKEEDDDEEGTEEATPCKTNVQVHLPRLTSFYEYLYQSLSTTTSSSSIKSASTSMSTSMSILLDDNDVRDVLQSIGSTFPALASFVQQRAHLDTQSACEAVLDLLPFSTQLFPEQDDNLDDITSRCQYRALQVLSANDVVGGGVGTGGGGGGGGGGGLSEIMGLGNREEKEGAPSVRWRDGHLLLHDEYEGRLQQFLTAVEEVGYLRLRLPRNKVDVVIEVDSMKDEIGIFSDANDVVVTSSLSQQQVGVEYVSVKDCKFELDTLWSSSFRRFVSDERRGHVEHGWRAEQQVERLEALVRQKYAKDDATECQQEQEELQKEENTTKEAWEKAKKMRNEGILDDREWFKLQLKLDQRKGKERTIRYELERRIRHIDTNRYDAERVLERFRSVRDSTRS